MSEVENVTLAYGNVIENAVLSGGAAEPNMPLTNLQDIQPSMVWRSVDLDLASTKFQATYVNSELVRAIVIARHNISIGGKIRIRGSDDPAFPVASVGTPGSPMGLTLLFTYADSGGVTVHDTGWMDVWPSVYDSLDLEWESDNFWSGKFLEEDIEGYNTFCFLLPQNVRVMHWLFEIDDQNNPAGYVQAGRLFMAPYWQPSRNASFGATLGWDTDTEVQSAMSGAEYFDVKEPYRVAQVKFNYMTRNEGLSGPFEIVKKSGIHGEIMFMMDPADTLNAPRLQFLGRLRVLSPLEFPEGLLDGDLRTAMAMEIKERVA